ncbi:MAG: hypothetical protein COS37_05685 [Anaerolineae bacterium CG03_land_8_20_14_0_80_58_20]|nr:MAG: hypothetical protein COS37_05685 [Anaerolineae bacterium CG03_land_8_20_14_0_80_58_20]
MGITGQFLHNVGSGPAAVGETVSVGEGVGLGVSVGVADGVRLGIIASVGVRGASVNVGNARRRGKEYVGVNVAGMKA